MSESHFEIWWIDQEREPKCAPNPDYPKGIDIDLSLGRTPKCKVDLPYPAKRCGFFSIDCKRCGASTMLTTAGRPDDPRSITLACDI